MANVLHLHGKMPCQGHECAPRPPRRITEAEFKAAGINPRQGDEAQGVCPDSGLDLQHCIAGPCDCFLDSGKVSDFVDSCQRELIRQAKIRRGNAS
jgi:hypothetical protein